MLLTEANAFVQAVTDACNIPKSGTLNRAGSPIELSCIKNRFELQRTQLLNRLRGEALEEASLPPSDIISIQTQLKAKGFLPDSSRADGVLGPMTRTAITEWQRSVGLRQTGFASTSMLTQFLSSTAGPTAPPSSVATPQTVTPDLADRERQLAEREKQLAEQKAAKEQAERDRQLVEQKAAQRRAEDEAKQRAAAEKAEKDRQLAEREKQLAEQRAAQEQVEKDRQLAEREKQVKEQQESQRAQNIMVAIVLGVLALFAGLGFAAQQRAKATAVTVPLPSSTASPPSEEKAEPLKRDALSAREHEARMDVDPQPTNFPSAFRQPDAGTLKKPVPWFLQPLYYLVLLMGPGKAAVLLVVTLLVVLGAIIGPQYGESNSPRSTTVQSPPVNQTPTDITNSFQNCRTMSTQAFAQCQQQSSTPVAKEGCASTLKWSMGNCQRRYECEMYKRC